VVAGSGSSITRSSAAATAPAPAHDDLTGDPAGDPAGDSDRASTPPARTRLNRDQRRAVFLDAAVEIIVDQGADAVTMEGIAARAGVSKALGYRFFTNRDQVLVEVFDREMAVLDARMIQAAAIDDDLETKIRGVVQVWVAIVAERGELLGMLQQSKLIEGPVEARRRQRQKRVDQFFADLIGTDYDLAPEDARLVAAVLVDGTQGAIRSWFINGWSQEQITERYVRLSLGAIEALARDRA